MNILFEYTFLIIFLVVVILGLVKFTKSGFLQIKEWLLIFLGAVIITSVGFAVINGIKINERVQVEFNVPKDFYSEWEIDSLQNPISDKILYEYLVSMRAPHPKIIVAQAKLESNNFQSDLFKRQKNFLGMKYSHKRVTTANGTKGEYKTYNTWQESAIDYLFWMFSRNVDKLSNEEYLRYLGKVYAEDPQYVTKLKNIMGKFSFK